MRVLKAVRTGGYQELGGLGSFVNSTHMPTMSYRNIIAVLIAPYRKMTLTLDPPDTSIDLEIMLM